MTPLPSGPSFLSLLWRRLRGRPISPLRLVIEAARAGDLSRWRAGARVLVQVNHPALVEEVLLARAAEFPRAPHLQRALAPILGRGLLVDDGPSHRDERARLLPAFGPAALSLRLPALVERVRQWRDARVPGTALTTPMSELTLELAMRVMMGDRSARHAARLNTLVHALDPHARRAVAAPWVVPDWLPWPGRAARRAIMAEVQDILSKILGDRGIDAAEAPCEDALGLLVAGRHPVSAAVRDGMFSLLSASQEGTAASVLFTLRLLADHPAEQEAVVREVRERLGEGPPDEGALVELPRLDGALREAWRLYPPGWLTLRFSPKRTELGGYLLPKGSTLAIAPYALHRDPRWYPEPDRFLPERWTGGLEQELRPGIWLPFGAGAHRCLGRALGLLEARLILALLLQRFTAEPVGARFAPSPGITLKPRGEIVRLVGG